MPATFLAASIADVHKVFGEKFQEFLWCLRVDLSRFIFPSVGILGVKSHERAYLAPFLVFMAFLALGELAHALFEGFALWVVATPRYWLYPLQTVVCGALLVWYWTEYRWQHPAKLLFTITIAAIVFGIWVAPQEFLGALRRTDGFEPDFFGHGPIFFLNVGLRFLRLVVVVPLLEEVFWRGFLLRYLIREDFTRVQFGTFTWPSFGLVALFFAFAHWGPDFGAALITGALYNWVAYRTKRLSSCVIAHALTNLLLGTYVLHTRQWGFW